jgi:hypothetical protein
MHRKTYGPKQDELSEQFKILHSKEFNGLYKPPW